jgi:DNA mismatch repair protein MutS
MAGMPKKVLQRANEILLELESDRVNRQDKSDTQSALTRIGKAKQEDYQLSFFQLNDPVLEQIREQLDKTDINTLTPVEALMRLNEIKKLTGGLIFF